MAVKRVDLKQSLQAARMRRVKELAQLSAQIRQIDKALVVLNERPEFHKLLTQVCEAFINNRW
jgi:hypothetical protein